VLFYGEEIGMGENLAIDGRLSVRTPMQWSDGPNGGFSTAPARRLVRPVTPGRFGPMAVNVGEQQRDADSMLNWMERLIRRRNETPELGRGTYTVLAADHPCVLAMQSTADESTCLTLHNLAADPAVVHVPLEGDVDEVVDLLDGRTASGPVSGKLEVKLEGFGYRWFHLRRPQEASGT
jgi:glycosidase